MASTKGRLLDDVTASLIYSGLPHCNGNENELYCPIAGCSRSKDKGKCFHQMSQLKNHFALVHCEKNFKCPKCGKKFGLHSTMTRHLKECGNEYSCTVCGESFQIKNSLYMHMKRKGHKSGSIDVRKITNNNTTYNAVSPSTFSPVSALIQNSPSSSLQPSSSNNDFINKSSSVNRYPISTSIPVATSSFQPSILAGVQTLVTHINDNSEGTGDALSQAEMQNLSGPTLVSNVVSTSPDPTDDISNATDFSTQTACGSSDDGTVFVLSQSVAAAKTSPSKVKSPEKSKGPAELQTTSPLPPLPFSQLATGISHLKPLSPVTIDGHPLPTGASDPVVPTSPLRAAAKKLFTGTVSQLGPPSSVVSTLPHAQHSPSSSGSLPSTIHPSKRKKIEDHNLSPNTTFERNVARPAPFSVKQHNPTTSVSYKTYTCEKCLASFASRWTYIFHRRDCGFEYKCCDCGRFYKVKNSLFAHQKRKNHRSGYIKKSLRCEVPMDHTPSQVAEPSEKKQAAVIEPVSCHSNSSTRLPQVTSVAAGEQTSDGSQYVVVPVLVPADSQLATMFSASSISINAPSSSQPTPKKGYPEPYRCQCFNDRQIIKVKDTATQTDGGIHQSTLNSGAVCDEESMFSVHVQTGRNLELTELLDLSTQTELQNDLLDFGTQTLLNYSEQGSQTNILNDFILTNAFGTQTD